MTKLTDQDNGDANRQAQVGGEIHSRLESYSMGTVLRALRTCESLSEKSMLSDLSEAEELELTEAVRILTDSRSDYYRNQIRHARRDFLCGEPVEDEDSVEDEGSKEMDDMFASASNIRRSHWYPTSIGADAQTNLRLVGPEYASKEELSEDLRPPIVAASFRALGQGERLFPEMIAEEAVIMLLSGQLDFIARIGGQDQTMSLMATPDRVSILRLRSAEAADNLWLPSLSVSNAGDEPFGLVFFASPHGVPYREILNGRLMFDPLNAEASQGEFFASTFQNNPRALLTSYVIERKASLDTGLFPHKSEHPHAKATEIGNFVLREYFGDTQARRLSAPNMRILELGDQQGKDISLATHDGIEYLLPIFGQVRVHVGDPEKIAVDRGLDHGVSSITLSPKEQIGYSQMGLARSIRLSSDIDDTQADQIIRIDSRARFHGFSSIGGAGRAVFLGVGDNRCASGWKKYYEVATRKWGMA